MANDIDWQRVANAINDRMGVLTLTQSALAEQADVSPITIRRLMYTIQHSYRRDSLVKVSTALGWGPDGIARIGRGEDPADVEAQADSLTSDESAMLILRRIEEQLANLTEMVHGIAR